MRQVFGYHKFQGIKVIPFLGLLLLIMICMTACNPLKKEETVVDKAQVQLEEWKTCSPKEIAEHITMEFSESYRIDANILLSDELEGYEVKNINLTRHVYSDVEEVLERWGSYCGKTQEGDIQVFEAEELLEDGEQMRAAMVEFAEEGSSWAQVRSVYALMHSPFMDNYGIWRLDGIYDRQILGRANYELARGAAEEDFLSETQILDVKKEMESIWGVEFLEDYELYSYTRERLEEILEWEKTYMEAMGRIHEDIRWDVTEADEGVILSFRQGYEGVPILHDGPDLNETGSVWLVDNYCILTLSRNGIEGLEFMNPYDVKSEAEAVEILSFGEFIEKHMESRAALDTTVVHVGLYYLPIYSGEGLDFTTKPVWYVQTEAEQADGYMLRDSTLYDAVTGEQILWY